MAAFKLNVADLVFVLKQVKIAEAHSQGTPLMEIWVDALGNVVAANTPGATLAIPSVLAPFGLRTVNGSFNNLVEGRETWGAADQPMPHLLPTYLRNDADGDQFDANGPGPGGLVTNNNYGNNGSVADADPRLISNLVSDMSFNNPAAIVAALTFNGVEAIYGPGGALETIQTAFADLRAVLDNPHTAPQAEAANAAFDAVLAPFGVEHNGASISIPNVAPDEGLSAPYNAWMTFFGQFFDHGLDLINKGGNGTVFVPLTADDPLMTHGADGIAGTGDELSLPQNAHLAFMALTRATPSGDTEVNQTTPFVDQNQTYTSNASHQVFLREYHLVEGRPLATGHLLDGSDANETVSSLPTWADVKAQAANVLGILLTDRDVGNIPVLRVDQYGEFVRGPNGLPQILAGVDVNGDSIWVEGRLPDPIAEPPVTAINPSAIQLPVGTVLFGGNVIEEGETVSAVRTGHAFLDDIAHSAAPLVVGGVLVQDADVTGDPDSVGNAIAINPTTGQRLEYDNELLDQHYITGDGRGNENIGLTTVHHIFHGEHNRQVEQQKLTILQSGDLAFVNEWLAVDIDQATLDGLAGMSLLDLTAAASTMSWDGERLFQSARVATEMQYQHLVFEEFARKIQPNIDVFVFNTNPDINPAIFAEFAHVVYRFGHSMLTDNMPRLDANGDPMAAMKADGTPLTAEEFGLVASFLNPVSFDHDGAITDDQGAAAIIRGMTIERGNEIDEFLVDALRNNLLGLPLDLGAINIARGRDTGMPSLNQARQALFDASGSTFLEPYDNWTDFAANLKHPISVINFIAAYGTHASITSATTAEAKRDAAWLLVMGGDGAPADRMDFLTANGAYADKGGLNEIDLWIGGLAEKKMPFGGFLGSTFNAVFELQLENLQDGDRFYYLTRTQGQNFLVSLEQNSFAKMIMANTDLSQPGADGIRGTADDIIARHMGVDSFAVYDHVLEVNDANQVDYNTASPEAIAAATQARDTAQSAYNAAVVADNAADVAAANAAAALAAAQAAAASDAVALRNLANAAQADANALTTTAEFNAMVAALALANGSDAAALQAAAAAAQAVADATDAAALQAAATQALADDNAAAAAQATALLTDAAALQIDADNAAADDLAAANAVIAAADAAQAELDAQAALAAAEAALADLITNGAPQVDIDAATVVRDDAQIDYDAAVLASDAADQAVIDTQAVADLTDQVVLQNQANSAAADDAAAVAAQLLADATNAPALQSAADSAAADDAAAATAQALAAAAVAADLGLAAAVNAYLVALAADQAADAAAAAADATADAAEAADAAETAAVAVAAAANSAAVASEAAEVAALAALNQAQADLVAAGINPAGKDPVGNNPVLEAAGLGKVIRDDLSTPGADTNYIRVQGGEHTAVGGTIGDDTIITDFGDDGIWGDAGNDRIESGAGVDLANGGSGDDIITDSGDTGDFLKGDEGDDVISGGNGLDIYMGGEGKDVVIMSVDASETFAGQGDDFVLGGLDADVIMGNEGDDWIEGGAGFDGIDGDMSELFFNSKIIGHDVLFSGADEQDFEGESGDDIMVQGESVIRNGGQMGFDWVTYKGNSQSADVDLARPIFTTAVQDILRNRFDQVEAASGYNANDLLVGDDRIYDVNAIAVANVDGVAGTVFYRDDINQRAIDRIAGLDEVITAAEMTAGRLHTAEFADLNPNAPLEAVFGDGNVLIGGGGDDVLIGKAGNDILDGDRWLNVRIRITAAGDDNLPENEIATIDTLEHVFTAETAGANTTWIGKSVSQLLIDRVIVPSQMHIVREILDGDAGNTATDTAVFWDVADNYTVVEREPGTFVVTHDTVTAGGVLPPGFTKGFSDGVDVIRNVEMLRFGNGLGGFIDFTVAERVQLPTVGAAVVNDLTPTEAQVLSVDIASIQDPNGISALTIQWQSSADGTTWTDIAGETNATLALPDAAGIAVTPLWNQFIKAVVTVTDDLGGPLGTTIIESAVTDRVGQRFTTNVAATFTGPATNDTLIGSGAADNLNGGTGNDSVSGGGGNDLLAGGPGSDFIDGQAGSDTARWALAMDQFSLGTIGGTTDIRVSYHAGNNGTDTLRSIETLQFGAATFAVVMGTNGGNTLGVAGTTSEALFGRGGSDTLNGNGGSDILVGGAGVLDTVNGGDGDDWIYQVGSTDGRDFIDGGNGTDTYTLSGTAGAETFNIYARAAAITAGFGAGLNAATEIVITRNGTVIAELDNVEEIKVNSLVATGEVLPTDQNGNGTVDGGALDGDTVNIFGDFSAPFTSLAYNTIRVSGSNANDTVDISGLTSDHRLVFTANGGSDTVLGAVREQDTINGAVNDLRNSGFGTQDGLNAMVGGQVQTADLGSSASTAAEASLTMVDTGAADFQPLDVVVDVAPMIAHEPAQFTGPDFRQIMTDYQLV